MIKVAKGVIILLIVITVLMVIELLTTDASTRKNISSGQDQNGKTSAPATQVQDDERVAIGTNLVNVNVTVTGADGKYVRGLAREQFEVFDDDVRQQIAF